jgi:hypothetical protein
MKSVGGRFPRLGKAVVVSVLLVSGMIGWFACIDQWDARQQDALSRWPTVTRDVLSANRETRGDYDDEYTVVVIRFGYRLGGVSYQSS